VPCSPRVRLFATDLDGTLLDRDGRVRPEDKAAIADARARGVTVTIATGRLTSGTHGIADELGLDAPLVCADGGVTACSATRKILARRPIDGATVDGLLGSIEQRGLATFVFNQGAIHSCELGAAHHAYVRGWSPAISTHASIRAADAWRADEDGVVMIVAIGAPSAVDQLVAHAAAAAPSVDVLAFGIDFGKLGVARFVSRGTSKGAALADLARRLGVAQRDVAVAGDWLNDLSMFEWAGRSFAMPHAPSEVKRKATDRLGEGSGAGTVAEALARWLDDGDAGVRTP
jgi:Cof subfamily protein (haloacid dehalogenase superfamily)